MTRPTRLNDEEFFRLIDRSSPAVSNPELAYRSGYTLRQVVRRLRRLVDTGKVKTVGRTHNRLITVRN